MFTARQHLPGVIPPRDIIKKYGSKYDEYNLTLLVECFGLKSAQALLDHCDENMNKWQEAFPSHWAAHDLHKVIASKKEIYINIQQLISGQQAVPAFQNHTLGETMRFSGGLTQHLKGYLTSASTMYDEPRFASMGASMATSMNQGNSAQICFLLTAIQSHPLGHRIINKINEGIREGHLKYFQLQIVAQFIPAEAQQLMAFLDLIQKATEEILGPGVCKLLMDQAEALLRSELDTK